jgi:hypothetical protein
MDNRFINVKLYIQTFQIKLIWLRIRLHLSGLKTDIEFKDRFPGYKHSYLAQLTQNERKSLQRLSFMGKLINQMTLKSDKKKYFQLIKNKFFPKHIFTKDKFPEINNVDNLNVIKKISIIEYFIRITIRLCDCLIEDTNVLINVNGNDFSFALYMRKLLFGVVKGVSKHKEILIITSAYDIKINEYREIIPIKKHGKLYKFNLLSLDTIFLHFKLEKGFFNDPKSYMTLVNTFSIKTEVYKLDGNISALVITNIFAMVGQIIRIITTDEFADVTTKKENTIVKCNEQHIIEKLEGLFRKMKIVVTDLQINIFSDDFMFKYLKLNANHMSFINKNKINDFYDQNSIKLLTASIDIKLQELAIFTGSDIPITRYPIFSIFLKEGITYNYNAMDTEISNSMSCDLSNLEVSLSTQQLNKIIELALSIVKGIDEIEEIENNNSRIIIYEPYKDSTAINFKFSEMCLNLFSDDIIAEIPKFSMDLRIEKTKFISSKIVINTSPVILSIANATYIKYRSDNKNFYFITNIFLGGFRLEINDTLNNANAKYFSDKSSNYTKISEIRIIFDYISCTLFDNHLIDTIKFVSEFLTYIFKTAAREKHKKVPNNSKQEKIEIIITKADLLKYIDFNDIIIAKVKDFTLVVDDKLEMPDVTFYHQDINHVPLQPKTKVIKLKNFIIKFDQDNIDILFYSININFYTIKFGHTIAKISIFYRFFPEWLDYYFINQFMLDDKFKEINISENAKKSRVTITFQKIEALINDTPISSGAIMFAKPQDIENNKNNLVKYLNNIKNNLFTLRVTNFIIDIEDFYERKVDNENNVNNYITSIQKSNNL